MNITRCEKCAYAEVLQKARTVRCGDMVMYQGKGSTVCRCEHITSMTITDDGMICSSFREKEDASNDA